MHKARTQLLEDILSRMSELYRSFATNRDGFLATFQLSRAQLELLLSLKHGPQNTGMLAKKFNVSSSAISQLVDQLEEKKLVNRSSDPSDRRVRLVQLAPAASQRFAKFRREFIGHLNTRFEDVSTAEFEQLLSILTKITNNIGV